LEEEAKEKLEKAAIVFAVLLLIAIAYVTYVQPVLVQGEPPKDGGSNGTGQLRGCFELQGFLCKENEKCSAELLQATESNCCSEACISAEPYAGGTYAGEGIEIDGTATEEQKEKIREYIQEQLSSKNPIDEGSEGIEGGGGTGSAVVLGIPCELPNGHPILYCDCMDICLSEEVPQEECELICYGRQVEAS